MRNVSTLIRAATCLTISAPFVQAGCPPYTQKHNNVSHSTKTTIWWAQSTLILRLCSLLYMHFRHSHWRLCTPQWNMQDYSWWYGSRCDCGCSWGFFVCGNLWSYLGMLIGIYLPILITVHSDFKMFAANACQTVTLIVVWSVSWMFLLKIFDKQQEMIR